jgi:L-threonylcarbamoyladenylate synthase
MDSEINKAIDILNNGGIIIFPTDTAFGIGCRIDKPQSIQKLFDIRKRPLEQATPVLVSGIEMARKYLREIPQKVETELIDKYWPGGLTIILPANKELVPSLVRGGGENLGVRMPNNKTLLEIIEKVGVPLLGPSANFHSEPTPFIFSDLNINLTKQVDYVLDGQINSKTTSTVIDCSVDPWKILRLGSVSININ